MRKDVAAVISLRKNDMSGLFWFAVIIGFFMEEIQEIGVAVKDFIVRKLNQL